MFAGTQVQVHVWQAEPNFQILEHDIFHRFVLKWAQLALRILTDPLFDPFAIVFAQWVP